MLKNLSDALFGGRCFLCRGDARDLLCPACASDLPRLAPPRCPRCALASPQGGVCGRCLAHAPRYDATVAALEYAFPADVLIQALKFHGELALAPFLAGLLLAGMQALDADCVVAVPLSARRLRERGYNQAVELARPLAFAARATLDLRLCERARDTPQQADLPWAERARNVRGAFRCTRRIAPDTTVAVVDDVMTTGATLDEIAAVLKEAGAARVVNCVLARTLPPD
jgi:ComF family protein